MSESLVNGEPKWRNAESQSELLINVKQFEDRIA